MKKDKKNKKKLEFSKFILSSCMIIYILTVIFGVVYYSVLHKDEAMDLNGLFIFVGSPTGIAIGFYVWKAKCENIHKNPDITIETAKKAESDELCTEEAYNDGNPEFNTDNSCFDSNSCGTSISDNQSETEMRRMVKVRRIGSGKTTRRGNRSA